MKIIEWVIKNPIIIALIMLKDIIEIVEKIINGFKNTKMVNANFDYYDFTMRLVMAISLWFVIRAYFKLKHEFEDKMHVFNLISFIRNKRLFVKSYDNVTFYKLPNDTNESYYSRIPEGGLFDKLYQEEYDIVRAELINNDMKHKKVEEIDALLEKFYPINNV